MASGVSGIGSPPFVGCGLSGIAVCTSVPGDCGERPATANPNGLACVTTRSVLRNASVLTCALASPSPNSVTDCFGNCSPSPGRIVFVGTPCGPSRTTLSPVPASPTACASGCGPFGADAGGWFGSRGPGTGVVGGCASAGAAINASSNPASGTDNERRMNHSSTVGRW